jgi:REP element-mobilizing transposase RayT
LLKFEKDRKRWLYWLFEAKKRYGLCVLNYIVTSNHIHLLVVDTEEKTISQSLQLIAGRTAQEFNTRKNRKGSFWEDRYHATAVDTDNHLVKCMVYIDLNMVRAGAVAHPYEYRSSGYNEIQNPPKRYGIINRRMLLDYFSMRDENRFREEHSNWITVELKNNALTRNSDWSEAIAVGNKPFLKNIQEKLTSRAQKRSIVENNGSAVLKEPEIPYSTVLDGKKDSLSHKNTYFWR